LGSVPHSSSDFVCKLCLGPVSDFFTHCYGCNKLSETAPAGLWRHVVPMTTALNPSSWYSRLVAYKTVGGESMLVLAALTSVYLTAHRSHLSSLLGGNPSVITVVPSTRGRPFEQHPLPRALRLATALRDHVIRAVSFVPNATIGRQEYKPSVFRADKDTVAGGRIVLIEDTWVSGSKALSAAGALLEAGAAAVVVVPIAREIRPGFWGADHPYLQSSRSPYDVNFWPR